MGFFLLPRGGLLVERTLGNLRYRKGSAFGKAKVVNSTVDDEFMARGIYKV